MKKSVLLLETIAEEAMDLLEEQVNVINGYNSDLPSEVELELIEGIITRGKGQVDEALLDSCPRVAVVARCGVGLDNIAVTAATARGVKVVNTPGANGATVAEHTLSLMLLAIRQVYSLVSEVKQDNWECRNTYAGDELGGKTLGILGMGNIGKRVARLAEAFGMRVVYWSRTKQADVPYAYHSKEEVLQQADILTLHLPYTANSKPLVTASELAMMKPNAYLINTARGALIDHEALLDSLRAGLLGGFAADVLPDMAVETRTSLLSRRNVLVTPHAASLTSTTYRQMCLLAVRNVLAILNGENADVNSIFNAKDLT